MPSVSAIARAWSEGEAIPLSAVASCSGSCSSQKPSLETHHASRPLLRRTAAAGWRSSTSMTRRLGKLRDTLTDFTQGLVLICSTIFCSLTLNSVDPSGTAASDEMVSLVMCSVGVATMLLMANRPEYTSTR